MTSSKTAFQLDICAWSDMSHWIALTAYKYTIFHTVFKKQDTYLRHTCDCVCCAEVVGLDDWCISSCVCVRSSLSIPWVAVVSIVSLLCTRMLRVRCCMERLRAEITFCCALRLVRLCNKFEVIWGVRSRVRTLLLLLLCFFFRFAKAPACKHAWESRTNRLLRLRCTSWYSSIGLQVIIGNKGDQWWISLITHIWWATGKQSQRSHRVQWSSP